MRVLAIAAALAASFILPTSAVAQATTTTGAQACLATWKERVERRGRATNWMNRRYAQCLQDIGATPAQVFEAEGQIEVVSAEGAAMIRTVFGSQPVSAHARQQAIAMNRSLAFPRPAACPHGESIIYGGALYCPRGLR